MVSSVYPLSFSELSKLKTFKERYEYLRIKSQAIGEETFGYERCLNQTFYRSPEWKRVRNLVILRDGGCDMGLEGFPIGGRIYIHHINPILPEYIRNRDDLLMNMDNLVCVSFDTHQAIHWGSEIFVQNGPVERRPNDTCPWR